jgi:hypothetical protein
MANYKITKMDGRHSGRDKFSHYINYNVYVRGVITSISTNEVNFVNARVWFWETFGPSAELGKCHRITNRIEPVQWAWQAEHNLLRIYVTEKALDFFLLTHSA